MLTATDPITKSLADLRGGDRALVIGITGSDPAFNAKLAARGLVPGVIVGIVRDGDPVLVAVDESRWALTRRDADRIEVDVVEHGRRSLFTRLLRR